MRGMHDAVVIGAGHNGLVAANLLADAGWDVTVLEAESEPGGAVRTAELTEPGFRHDVYSAFYPLAMVSPAIRSLELESHGLRWRRGPLGAAHPTADGSCAVIAADVDDTAASLDAFAPGDGDAWKRLYELWLRVEEDLATAIVTPMPPLRPSLRLARTLGADLPRFLRFLALPVRRMAEEEFRGDGAARLIAGHAAHADLAPEMPLSGALGWTMAMAGQQHGFPTPEGGAGELAGALVRRLESRGGTVTCDAAVAEVLVRDGRTEGVRTEGGDVVGARRAVIADVDAPSLYGGLVAREHLPARLVEDIARFQYDWATFKVDWALDAPIPWRAEPARRAGVIHVSEGIDELTSAAGQIAMGVIPATPSLVMGQYAMVDETRFPPGADTAWAYTHLPRRVRGDGGGELTGAWDEREADAFAARIEARVEALAPGFGALVRGRSILTPAALQAGDRNVVLGSMHGGTAQLHQQAIFRPAPGWGRPETPVAGLYLGSASAHPGGGVHGGPGANAARAALAWHRRPAHAVVRRRRRGAQR
jgi:phytoene dehydrogenase-like protein